MPAVGERTEERPRRPDLLGVLLDQGELGRRQSGRLEDAGEHATGVRAERSGRGQQDDVDPVPLQQLRHLRPGVPFEHVPRPQGAHERIEVLRQSADRRALLELPQAIDRIRAPDNRPVGNWNGCQGRSANTSGHASFVVPVRRCLLLLRLDQPIVGRS